MGRKSLFQGSRYWERRDAEIVNAKKSEEGGKISVEFLAVSLARFLFARIPGRFSCFPIHTS